MKNRCSLFLLYKNIPRKRRKHSRFRGINYILATVYIASAFEKRKFFASQMIVSFIF